MAKVIRTAKETKFTGSPQILHNQEKHHHHSKKTVEIDPVLAGGHIIHGWYFDCCCGVHGVNYDDAKRSIQCNVCKIWMHCKCNHVPTKESEICEYFENTNVWVCSSCKSGKYRYRGILWEIPDSNPERATVVESASLPTMEATCAKKVEFKLKPSIASSMSVSNFPDATQSSLRPILKAPREFGDGIPLPTPENITITNTKVPKTANLKRFAHQVKQFYVEEIMAPEVQVPHVSHKSSSSRVPISRTSSDHSDSVQSSGTSRHHSIEHNTPSDQTTSLPRHNSLDHIDSSPTNQSSKSVGQHDSPVFESNHSHHKHHKVHLPHFHLPHKHKEHGEEVKHPDSSHPHSPNYKHHDHKAHSMPHGKEEGHASHSHHFGHHSPVHIHIPHVHLPFGHKHRTHSDQNHKSHEDNTHNHGHHNGHFHLPHVHLFGHKHEEKSHSDPVQLLDNNFSHSEPLLHKH